MKRPTSPTNNLPPIQSKRTATNRSEVALVAPEDPVQSSFGKLSRRVANGFRPIGAPLAIALALAAVASAQPTCGSITGVAGALPGEGFTSYAIDLDGSDDTVTIASCPALKNQLN